MRQKPTQISCFSPLRIAFVMASETHGGASIMTLRQAKGLAKLGHEVIVYCAGEIASKRKENGVHIEILNQSNSAKIYHYINPVLIARLMFRLRSFKPDILHFIAINLRTFSLSALELSHLYPTVWTLKDVWPLCMTGWPDPPDCKGMLEGCSNCMTWPKWQVRFNRAFKETVYATSPMQIAVPSKWLANLVQGSSILGKKSITIIPNGLDQNCWYFGAIRNYSKNTYYNNPIKLLYPAGRLLANTLPAERKGLSDMLTAIRILKRKNLNFEVLFAGDIDESKKQDAADLPIRWFSGCSYEQMQQLYKDSDIFVLPSLGDNFPATIFEAMAAGLPVVSTWTGGIPEAVVNEKTGILVSPRDHNALAKGIKRLIEDADLRKKFGRAGRSRFEKKYTSERMIEAYNALFYKVNNYF